MIKCRFCSVANDDKTSNCVSCGAPMLQRSTLGEDDIKNLKNYILSIENTLQTAKKKADGKIMAAFAVFAILWIASSLGIYSYKKDDLKLVVFFIVTTGSLLFIIFGGFVGKFETMETEALFRKKIKNEITEYLELMQYSSADFRITAGTVLNEKSCLNEFLAYL